MVKAQQCSHPTIGVQRQRWLGKHDWPSDGTIRTKAVAVAKGRNTFCGSLKSITYRSRRWQSTILQNTPDATIAAWASWILMTRSRCCYGVVVVSVHCCSGCQCCCCCACFVAATIANAPPADESTPGSSTVPAVAPRSRTITIKRTYPLARIRCETENLRAALPRIASHVSRKRLTNNKRLAKISVS